MERGTDDQVILEMIRAARQAVQYRQLALAGGPHRDRFVRTAIACSQRVRVLAEDFIAHRQAEGLGGWRS
jgi:hypothetical protein